MNCPGAQTTTVVGLTLWLIWKIYPMMVLSFGKHLPQTMIFLPRKAGDSETEVPPLRQMTAHLGAHAGSLLLP